MKRFFSRFHPRYVRSLVYMLQASEYKIADYLAWLRRTEDFSRVEKRKTLEHTKKAVALMAIAWAMLVLTVTIALIGAISINTWWSYVALVIILLAAPILLSYIITLPLLVLHIAIQKPSENFIVKRATEKLAQHQGIKIAIAGSFGKTSMREIVKTVLAEDKKVAAPGGSYNTPLGISKFIESLDGSEEILIFELGEYYKGDIKKLCDIVKPEIGIITGVNEAHLEKFKDLKTSTSTIFELAEYETVKKVYVNAENETAKEAARPQDALYSKESAGEVKALNAKTGLQGTTLTLEIKGAQEEAHSKLLGLHNIGPMLVASDIALSLGLHPKHIAEGIAQTKPFAHRMEPRTDQSGVTTIDDSYNGNPDGVTAVIEFLKTLEGHRRFYVTPGLVEMGDRKEVVHKKIGQQLAEAGIEKVVLIKNSVTPFIEQGLKETNYKGEIIWFNEALKAFEALPHMTLKDDVILIQNDWPDQYA